MKHVYGPVTSRRLGQSLGVDPVPLKTCNWNCVYCQLGRSRPVVNERRNWHPAEEIVSQAAQELAAHGPGEIQWVTFVGSGEPLLHARLGWMIRQVKALTDLPVAVITNGSLLYVPEVRAELVAADAVLPTLDAGNPDLYRRINRPHAQITFRRLVDGLIAFRGEYEGSLWPEVMLVRGLNDSEPALEEIAGWLERARADQIHINLPTRPPVEAWLRGPEEAGLRRAEAILGAVAPVCVAHSVEGTFDLGDSETVAEAVAAVIARHPLSEEELERVLARWTPDEVKQALTELGTGGYARLVTRHGKRFWVAAASYFPGRDAGSDVPVQELE